MKRWIAVFSTVTLLTTASANAQNASPPAAKQQPPPPFIPGMTPSPEVQAALRQERAEVKRVAALMNGSPAKMSAAQKALGELTAKIAKRLTKPHANLGMLVYMAVQQERGQQMATNPAAYQQMVGAQMAGAAPAIQNIASGAPGTDMVEAIQKVPGLIKQKKSAEALALLKKSFASSESLLRMLELTGTRSQIEPISKSLTFQVDLALQLATSDPSNADAVRFAFVASARRRARPLQIERGISSGLQSLPSDKATRLRNAWYEFREKISALELQASNGVTLTAKEQSDLFQLHLLEEKLVAGLARFSQESRVIDSTLSWDTLNADVGKRLASDQTLIAYVRFPAHTTAKSHDLYGAFVLTKQSLEFVELGSAASIDAAASTFSTSMLSTSSAALKNKQAAAKALYDVVVAPLGAKVRGAGSLRIVPDSTLALVSFAALHDGSSWLGAKQRLVYSISERDLLGSASPSPTRSQPVVIAGLPYAAQSGVRVGGRLSPADFPALTGATLEGKNVARALPKAITLQNPSDWSVSRLRPPPVLHIAAHGVLLPFEATTTRAPDRGVYVAQAKAAAPTSTPAATGNAKPTAANSTPAIDPLVRSAVVLQANATPASDGFLTGYEAATLNLHGTELVVLSACETGRGDPQRADSVQGLRSALFAAGAESMVMSLWGVDDSATQLLMQELYSRLGAKKARGQALDEAMAAVRAKYPDPYYWAPFVLIGDSDPLALFQPPPKSAAPTPAPSSPRTNTATSAQKPGQLEQVIAFRRMQRGALTPVGKGSWDYLGQPQRLVDQDVTRNLGPSQKNLKLNLLANGSAISVLIVNYRGPGSYTLRGGGSALVTRVANPLKLDVTALDPTLSSGERATAATIVVSRDNAKGMAGTFSLRLKSAKEIKGAFELGASR